MEVGGEGRKGKGVKERTEKLGSQGVLSDMATGREIALSSSSCVPSVAGWLEERSLTASGHA